MMGLTKLGEGITSEELKRPRRKLMGEQTIHRLPGTQTSSSLDTPVSAGATPSA